MLFSSLIFVYFFLPITIGIYWSVPRSLRNVVLLLASLVFYAWGEPTYVIIMFLTISVNYLGALIVDKVERGQRIALAATILANLSVLVYFKYFNFLAENLNAVFNTNVDFVKVIMPIGISFYTFQSLCYVVDVYRREVPVQCDITKLALYISFFPQLVAGPIVKYHDVAAEIENRSVSIDDFCYGIRRFIIGLAKKMLIANTMGSVADQIFAQSFADTPCPTAWIGAVAYAFQIFYDFSGYSDMAIGLGRMFGFHFLENFNYPYISKSITEFWRRWHISLSTWFRDYLYIPLGGNRVSPMRLYGNLFIVFLTTGIWHGAAWTFIFWGLWHGAFILFERVTGLHKQTGSRMITLAHHFYTCLVVLFGWIFFRSDTLSQAFGYIGNMLCLMPTNPSAIIIPCFVDNMEKIVFVVAAILSMPVTKGWFISERRPSWQCVLGDVWLMVLFLLSSMWMVSATYNPFIYFRF